MLMRLLCFAALALAVKANVIGVDIGSDTMKVAIVQPGMPLEIVTNFQSKRKTPTSISFYRGERQFGSDATALMTRKPDVTFSKVYRMLGRNADHPLVKEVTEKQFFPHEIYSNETTGHTNIKCENTQYSPEEVIAMIMQYVKEMTLNFGGKVIKDCVITVPAYFTQHERNALYTAADIADLRILSLMEENTAAALHYGIDRVFDEPKTIIYYNMGASSLQVTLATYSSYPVKEGGKNKTIGQFDVVGKAWETSLGGFNFDVVLAEMLADRFNEVWGKKASGKGKDVRDFTRPMARLRSEATKIREVLSGNKEFPLKIEQLHADVDFSTKITRGDFEAACASMYAKLTPPIDRALEMANMTLDQIDAVELLGGGVRMPKVKQALDDYFKGSKVEVGQHMNGDEAMALGSAFRAANISTAFRVRKVGMSDISPFAVSVAMETLPVEQKAGGFLGMFGKKGKKDESGDEWSKEAEIFPKGSSLFAKVKTVTFPYDKDILCKIEYSETGNELLPAGTDSLLAVYNITGISEFAKEAEQKNASAPKVHLSFALEASGVTNLVRAEVTAELPVVPEETGSIEPETPAGEEKKEEDEAASEKEGEAEGDESAESKEEVKEEKKADKKKDKKDKKDKKKDKKAKAETSLKRTLTVTDNPSLLSPKGWGLSHVLEAKGKLAAMTAADEARRAKEAAQNDLEGYIYRVKNKIADDEDALKAVSTDEQRGEVVAAADAAEDWLYDEGRNAEVTVYKAKQASLRKMAEAIFHRFEEMTDRPAAVKSAQDKLADMKAKAMKWAETKPQITEKETTSLLESIQKVYDWIEGKQEAQMGKQAHEEPAFDSSEVPVQMKSVVSTYSLLNKRPKPAPAKNETVTVDVNATDANATATDNSTEPTEKKPEAEAEGDAEEAAGEEL